MGKRDSKPEVNLPTDFSVMMSEAIQESLKGIDAANAALAEERKKLEREIDKARAARKKAEDNGERIAQDYFKKARAALIEYTRTELLRDLTWQHLQRGRAVEDICLWLGVKREFVERLIELMDRRADYLRSEYEKNRIVLEGNPRLHYKDEGRAGTITYENGETRFDMWWEMGFGRAMIIIDVPPETTWYARTGLRDEERARVLQFVAEQVISDQFSSSRGYEIGDAVITILR